MVGAHEVHVWRVELDSAPAPAHLPLSHTERARALRFRDAGLARRFAAAHGALRSILARYSGTPATGLTVVADARGKPYLPERPDLRFNLARSGAIALVAVSRREVGVDIEAQRHELGLIDAAVSALPAADAARISRLLATERAPAFYAAWTALEARVKCSGRGLAAGDQEAEDRHIHARPVHVADGYAAAVAARGLDWRVRTFG